MKKMLSLWERCQFSTTKVVENKYNYKYVGANYAPTLTTKEIALITRKQLKQQFPEVKFSVTSDYREIRVLIKSSPYDYKQLSYSPNLNSWDYERFEKENNQELVAILDYVKKFLSSYRMDDSDCMRDYYHTNFHITTNICSSYLALEQNENIKTEIENFRSQKKEIEQGQNVKKALYKTRAEQHNKDIKIVDSNVISVELEVTKRYTIKNVKMSNFNKLNTYEEYLEEIDESNFYLTNFKITKELHFSNFEALEVFKNSFLTDFDFLTSRNNTALAVLFDNKLQFVIDTEGYSYCRYVGITNE